MQRGNYQVLRALAASFLIQKKPAVLAFMSLPLRYVNNYKEKRKKRVALFVCYFSRVMWAATPPRFLWFIIKRRKQKQKTNKRGEEKCASHLSTDLTNDPTAWHCTIQGLTRFAVFQQQKPYLHHCLFVRLSSLPLIVNQSYNNANSCMKLKFINRSIKKKSNQKKLEIVGLTKEKVNERTNDLAAYCAVTTQSKEMAAAAFWASSDFKLVESKNKTLVVWACVCMCV